jgi:hypothetical protein
MDDDENRSQDDIEKQKIALERYKAQLDYRKFVLGSVFVAVAIAAIPPLFQLATAVLEYVKSSADRQAKQQAFRDDYIKEFVSNARAIWFPRFFNGGLATDCCFQYLERGENPQNKLLETQVSYIKPLEGETQNGKSRSNETAS